MGVRGEGGGKREGIEWKWRWRPEGGEMGEGRGEMGRRRKRDDTMQALCLLEQLIVSESKLLTLVLSNSATSTLGRDS